LQLISHSLDRANQHYNWTGLDERDSVAMPERQPPFREPSKAERMLLDLLAARWSDGPPGWVEQVRVREMDDGGMGSLRLAVSAGTDASQTFGRRAVEYEFTDADGIKVIASLNLDQDGAPFELDVWKVNFAPLTGRPNGPGVADS
jgi:hypothetical protein